MQRSLSGVAAFLDFFIDTKRLLLPCKSALSRHYAFFNLFFNKFSTLSTYPQVFHSFNTTNLSIQKMFNINQHLFNITFNILNYVNTSLDLHFHTFNAPTITTIILLLYLLFLLREMRLYTTTYKPHFSVPFSANCTYFLNTAVKTYNHF